MPQVSRAVCCEHFGCGMVIYIYIYIANYGQDYIGLMLVLNSLEYWVSCHCAVQLFELSECYQFNIPKVIFFRKTVPSTVTQPSGLFSLFGEW